MGSTMLIADIAKELEKDILDMKSKAGDERSAGLMNILDEALENCNKFQYRATQS